MAKKKKGNVSKSFFDRLPKELMVEVTASGWDSDAMMLTNLQDLGLEENQIMKVGIYKLVGTGVVYGPVKNQEYLERHIK